MDERMEQQVGKLWELLDDLDAIDQVVKDLHFLYEYEQEHRPRLVIKVIGNMIKQIRDQLQVIACEMTDGI